MIALRLQHMYAQTKEAMDLMVKRVKTRSLKPDGSFKIRNLEKEPRYNLDERIGRGGFSQVYVAYGKGGMRLPYKYCVKVSKLKEEEEEEETEEPEYDSDGDTIRKAPHSMKEEDCQKEYKLLRCSQDKGGLYVVHLFDCFQVQGYVWTVMEYLPFNLQQLIDFKAKIKKPAEKLQLWEVAVYVQKILLALKHLRSKRIVHRDVKPSNVLVSRAGKVKICDFGISRKIPEGKSHLIVESSEGTRQYMASELFCKGAKYDYSVDLWAVGVVMYNLCRKGRSPYGSRSGHFVTDCFKQMQKGFAYYIQYIFGSHMLTQAQYKAVNNEERGVVVTKSYEEFVTLFQKTVVPMPSHGCEEYPVTRKVEEKRITLEEFSDWVETTLANMDVGELRRRQAIIKHVGECVELKEQYERYLSEFSNDLLQTSSTD